MQWDETAAEARGGSAGLGRHAGVVSLLTAFSRVAGFARDAVLLHLFGATDATDAFLAAFFIPNAVRLLVADGAVSAGLLPLVAAATATSAACLRRLLGQALTLFLLLGLALTALYGVGAPMLLRLLAPGFSQAPAKAALGLELAYWMLPFLFTAVMAGLAGATLHARHHFVAPAASTLVFNLVHILTMVLGAFLIAPPILGAALGVALGGVAQLLLHISALRRTGLALVPPLPVTRRTAGGMLRHMVPACAAMAVHQLNLAAAGSCASFLGAGGVTQIYAADRFLQLPLGIFAVSLATVAMPSLAAAQAADRPLQAYRTFHQALRWLLVIMAPCSVGLMVLAGPIIATLWQHGRFDPRMAQASATTLAALAAGLLPLAAVRLTSQLFLAMGRARVVLGCAVVGLMGNLLFVAAVGMRWGAAGLAGGVSFAAWLQLALHLVLLKRSAPALWHGRPLLRGLGHDVAGAALMGGVLWLAAARGQWILGPTWANLLLLAGLVLGGALIYCGLHAGHRNSPLRGVWRAVHDGVIRRVIHRGCG